MHKSKLAFLGGLAALLIVAFVILWPAIHRSEVDGIDSPARSDAAPRSTSEDARISGRSRPAGTPAQEIPTGGRGLSTPRLELLRRSEAPVPIQLELRLSGNASFTQDEIFAETGLPQEFVLEHATSSIGAQILRFYEDQGYSGTRITRITTSGEKPVVVDVEIEEGAAYTLAGLSIIGAQAFSEEEIRGLYPPPGGTVNLSRLEEADYRLKILYVRSGFAEAQIRGQETRSESNKTSQYTVQVAEGPQYRVRFVSGPLDLVSKFPMRKGDVFNSSLLDEFRVTNHLDRANLEVQYTQQGLVDITIHQEPQVPND